MSERKGVTPELLQALSRRLTDDGKLIEAGFVGLRLAAIPLDAPQIQIDEMRKAFMAGAQHLFVSVMQVLDPGDGVTENDLRRMAQISAELDAFAAELTRSLATRGSA